MNQEQILFSQVCSEWLNMKRLCIKQSTYANYYRVITNHIEPEMGGLTLGELNSSKVNSFVYDKLNHGRLDQSGGLGNKTVRDICCILKSIIRYAEDEYQMGTLAHNSVIPKKIKKDMQVLSREEMRQLEKYLRRVPEENRCAGMLICMYTGLRLGEICALKWKDIDLQKEVIHIRHTIQRISIQDTVSNKKTTIIMDAPKSSCSHRTIPIPQSIQSVLWNLYHEEYKEEFFLTNSQKLIEPRNYQYFFKRCLQKAGIRNVNFHILRHTFASLCVEAGFDIKTLSEIMGHSNTTITLSYYVHSSLENKRKQMELLKI